MLTQIFQVICGIVALVLYRTMRARIQGRGQCPLPPGPPGLPFVGNIRDMPSTFACVTYKKWADTYCSPIVSLTVFGKTIIILNTLQAATDLLEKRSIVYSDRPRLVMFGELCGGAWALVLKCYGRAWRTQRKLLHSQLNAQMSKQYQQIQRESTIRFLQQLVETPADFEKHARLSMASQIAEIVYGYKIRSYDHPYMKLSEEAMECIAAAVGAGFYLVDIFSLLKYVPSWFPGASFQRQAAMWRRPVVALAEKPFAEYKQHAAQGDIPDCIAARLLQLLPRNDATITEEDVKEVLPSIFTAGVDTTTSVILSLILAMVLHPEALIKAQEEIDQVCHNRLPNFDDYDSLPYVEAVYREVLRWAFVTPEGVPHASTEDDFYEGYLIPKGSIMIPNTWAMLHDEAVYSDSFAFNPNRFIKDGVLDPDILNPEVAAFGFGRRICPGRFVAHDSVWILMACLFTVFDIHPYKDSTGQPILPSVEYTYGALCVPKPYKCDITPRSERHKALVMNMKVVYA